MQDASTTANAATTHASVRVDGTSSGPPRSLGGRWWRRSLGSRRRAAPAAAGPGAAAAAAGRGSGSGGRGPDGGGPKCCAARLRVLAGVLRTPGRGPPFCGGRARSRRSAGWPSRRASGARRSAAAPHAAGRVFGSTWGAPGCGARRRRRSGRADGAGVRRPATGGPRAAVRCCGPGCCSPRLGARVRQAGLGGPSAAGPAVGTRVLRARMCRADVLRAGMLRSRMRSLLQAGLGAGMLQPGVPRAGMRGPGAMRRGSGGQDCCGLACCQSGCPGPAPICCGREERGPLGPPPDRRMRAGRVHCRAGRPACPLQHRLQRPHLLRNRDRKRDRGRHRRHLRHGRPSLERLGLPLLLPRAGVDAQRPSCGEVLHPAEGEHAQHTASPTVVKISVRASEPIPSRAATSGVAAIAIG